jgi:hypothetical protein
MLSKELTPITETSVEETQTSNDTNEMRHNPGNGTCVVDSVNHGLDRYAVVKICDAIKLFAVVSNAAVL